MYVRVVSTPNSPRKSVRVAGSIRQGYQVKQVIIHHVGIASDDEEVEKLKGIGREWIAKELLREEQISKQLTLLPPEQVQEKALLLEQASDRRKGRKPKTTLQDISPEDRVCLKDLVEEKRVIEGIHDVAGSMYEKIGYETLLKRDKDNEMLKNLVLARLAHPASKYATQKILDKQFSISHDLDSLYRLMDKIEPKIGEIKQMACAQTLTWTNNTIDILFFDCTTLYFESTEVDEVRKFGYSKDHRFNTTQVVLALATNSDGLPIGYELFEGNKAEVKTLLECLRSWESLFKIGTVCFVADRAMMSDDNLKALEEAGHQYVIAAKLRSMPSELKEKILDEKQYTIQSFGDDVGWVGEFKYQSRRLVVSYKTGRAKRDSHQRNQVVEKIRKRLGAEGKTEKLISNKGVKKYTRSEQSQTLLDENKIALDAEWDGLHGVISNIEAGPGTELLKRYGRLWKIEESFRLNKHTLSMRPIYHFKPERIKAHIAICYMAFSVLRSMEYVAKLTQKITPQELLGELTNVQASYYQNVKTGRRYRMPGVFSHAASKIYRAFGLQRRNHAQELI